jgi:hypothetical protein
VLESTPATPASGNVLVKVEAGTLARLHLARRRWWRPAVAKRPSQLKPARNPQHPARAVAFKNRGFDTPVTATEGGAEAAAAAADDGDSGEQAAPAEAAAPAGSDGGGAQDATAAAAAGGGAEDAPAAAAGGGAQEAKQAMDRREALACLAQAFIGACSQAGVTASVDLKAPKVVLMAEMVPVGQQLVCGLSLVDQGMVQVKPKLNIRSVSA